MPNKAKPRKVIVLSKDKAAAWYNAANIFAHSQISQPEAIHMFNNLAPSIRLGIAKGLLDYDAARKNAFPSDMSEDEKKIHHRTSVMVDSHILATDYSTDPVVILMCVDPPCKADQKVLVK